MATKRPFRFQPGTTIEGNVTAEFLNEIEDRIFKLENLKVHAPLQILHTQKGMIISFHKALFYFVQISSDGVEDPDTEIVRADNELHPYEDAIVNILGFQALTAGLPGSNRIVDETAEDDTYPRIKVVDAFGISSQPGTKGIAIPHPNSEDLRLCFIPFPVAGGEPIENYNSTKNQALTHTGQGIPRWIDIDNCDITVHLVITDGASVAGTSIVTSVAAGFLASMVGSILQVVSGTNFVVGFYEIISFNSSSSITLAKDPTNGSSASNGQILIIN